MSQVGVDVGAGTYTFNKVTKTITFSGVTLTDISVISPIWNITRGVTIYNPAEVGKGFTSFNGTDLVLEFNTNTAGFDNTDKLKICVNTGAVQNVTATTSTDSMGEYAPNQETVVGVANLQTDPSGQLITRSTVLTDEDSYRDDFSGVALGAEWVSSTVSTGAISVANSRVRLASGATSGAKASIIRFGDYCPITGRFTASISQRVVNQIIRLGFITRDISGNITASAYIQFTGTNNQLINCISASGVAATDIQTTSNISLVQGFTTASLLYYKIDVSNNLVTFQVSNNGINYVPLTQHALHIPDPYAALDFEASIDNTGAATNTNVDVDLLFINNMDRLQIDQDFSGEPIASQLIGQSGNVYKSVNVSPTGELKVELGGNNVSAFGDINTAELTPVIGGDFVYGILTAIGATTVANTGIADTNSGRLRLQTGTNAAGASTYSSVKTAKYRQGQGIDAEFTRVYATGVANSQQECGMGNLTDGYFFGYVGATFGIIYRNSGVQTFIPQITWNGDNCDGTGASTFLLNPLFGNIYRIKYPYLGYGNVKFFIQDPTSGQFVMVHMIRYTNSSASTQLSNPNLKFWTRNVNTGNTTNLVGFVGSFSAKLSGVRKFFGATGFAFNNKTTAANTLLNIFTVKNSTSFNGVANESLIRITSITLSAGNLGNDRYGYLFLYKNPTLGGTPSFVPDSGSTADNGNTITSGQSPASVDTAGTTITGGVKVWGTNGVNTSNSFLDLTEMDIFIGTGETLSIVGFTTAASTLSAVINYQLDI